MAETVRVTVGMVFEFEGVSQEDALRSVQQLIRDRLLPPDQPGSTGIRRVWNGYLPPALPDVVREALIAAADDARKASAQRMADAGIEPPSGG
jgi:hypothetical protein